MENERSKAQEKIMEIYERTMKNCFFYQERGFKDALLNEIGVLRGIMYCMEAEGLYPNDENLSDIEHFIDIQQERKVAEGSWQG